MLKDIGTGAHLGNKPKLKYRPDIDGLRAFAVLSVVFFHADFSWCSGGYVGVDLFFVLSGFLITKIILSDLKKERFSIKVFYERRVKRLFPALFVHIAAIVAVSCFVFLPKDLAFLGENLIATSIFIANIFFWLESGYFAPASHELPLLHTWSLAVEEQFYIFWPILLWATYKWPQKLLKALLIIGGISSLALAQYWVETKPHWAFYLFPARSFELMIGAWLAFPFAPRLNNAALATPLSWLGMAGVCLPFFILNKETSFPGLAALPVCLGTAILIIVGQDHKTSVQRILENKWCIFIGLLSYSLYLWHWPIFALGRYFLERSFSTSEAIFAIVCSLLLSFLSWKYVEAPFRHSKSPYLLHWSVVPIVLVCALGWWMSTPTNIKFLYDPVVFEQDKKIHLKPPLQAKCHNPKGDAPQTEEHCAVGRGETVQAMLWGDSHANHYSPMLTKIAEQKGFQFIHVSRNGCLPVVGAERIDFSPKDRASCLKLTQNTLSYLEAHPELTTVYLAARWVSHAERALFGQEEGPIPVWANINAPQSHNTDNNHKVFSDSLTSTLQTLDQMGKKVILIGQTPELGFISGKCVLKKHMYGATEALQSCDIKREEVDLRQEFVNKELKRLSTQFSHVELVEVVAHLCSESWCPAQKDDVLLYKDEDHLSVAGSVWLADRLIEQLPTPQ